MYMFVCVCVYIYVYMSVTLHVCVHRWLGAHMWYMSTYYTLDVMNSAYNPVAIPAD